MIRQAARVASRRLHYNRSYASGSKSKPSTSPAKRALSEQQLKAKSEASSTGSTGSAAAGATSAAATGGASTTAKATPPPPLAPPPSASADPSSGGGGYMFPIAVILTGAGVAWYTGMIPGFDGGTTDKNPMMKAQQAVVKKEGHAVNKKELKHPAATAPVEPQAAVVKKEQAQQAAPARQKESNKQESNSKKSKKEQSAPDFVVKKEKEAPKKTKKKEEPPVEAIKKQTAPEPTSVSPKASIMQAAQELKASQSLESSATLQQARQTLRQELDTSLYNDLDKLTPEQLRVRVVQLGSEMSEKTKWEAVRLKEFLAMKEKEVGEKYMELMQKQRLEFEELMARKLRDQEDSLARQTNSAIQSKEAGIAAVVNATKESLEAEHAANMESARELIATECNAKYQVEFDQQMATEKQKFVDEMDAKVSVISQLSSKLEEMESALNVSRSFTDGSLKAHRVSAAAIALVEKMERSVAASGELSALRDAAEDNSVISSAVGSIPSSIQAGIPTISELQTKFETVHRKCRQAALVPSGRNGLEGQLLGIMLSTLKYAPNPDDAVPEDLKDDAEYVLSRARRHVQLGELERAVEQLDKLSGQANFTIRDWKQNAQDRIAADKALRVIKMEVALMNESLSKA